MTYDQILANPTFPIIVRAWAEGLSLSEIAERTATSKNTIVGRINRWRAVFAKAGHPNPLPFRPLPPGFRDKTIRNAGKPGWERPPQAKTPRALPRSAPRVPRAPLQTLPPLASIGVTAGTIEISERTLAGAPASAQTAAVAAAVADAPAEVPTRFLSATQRYRDTTCCFVVELRAAGDSRTRYCDAPTVDHPTYCALHRARLTAKRTGPAARTVTPFTIRSFAGP